MKEEKVETVYAIDTKDSTEYVMSEAIVEKETECFYWLTERQD